VTVLDETKNLMKTLRSACFVDDHKSEAALSDLAMAW